MTELYGLKARTLHTDPARESQVHIDNRGTMSFDWSTGGLAQGLQCYRNHEFFEAHEHWESVWLKCVEPEKTFLQALIQITAAFHHLQLGNSAGTRSLLNGALRRLDNYPSEFGGIAVGPLRQSVRAWLAVLKKEGDPPRLPFPTIR